MQLDGNPKEENLAKALGILYGDDYRPLLDIYTKEMRILAKEVQIVEYGKGWIKIKGKGGMFMFDTSNCIVKIRND